ncbi:MAG: lipocalin [Cryomorphaceae bacterium]|jgi:lipocalin
MLPMKYGTWVRSLIKKSSMHLLLLCMATLLASCTSYPDLKSTIDYIDQDRFAGEWYVISNIP